MAAPVPPPLGPNRPPAAKKGSAPTGGGPVAPPLGPNAKAASKGAAKKGDKKKSFLGVRLPTVFGVDLPDIGRSVRLPSPLTQARDMVAGAVPGLLRLGGQLGVESVRALREPHVLDRVADNATAGRSLGTNTVFDPAKRARDREQFPVAREITTSLARTARQVPDTAAAVRPGGPGFGQSDLGQQVKEQGVLGTGLAKVGDIATLAGGVGIAGRALGAGRLAQAANLERTATITAKAAGLAADEQVLAKAAFAADKAGDSARALDLAKAADQMAQATELRRVVPELGAATRAAERVTQGATAVNRVGNRAAAAPFLPSQKALGLVGKGAKAAARSKVAAPAMAKVDAAVANWQQRRAIGDLHHENVTAPFQAEMHTFFQRHGIEDAARHLDLDEQAAVYLTKSAEDIPARQLLDAVADLDPEVRPDVIGRLFRDGDVTPAQIELAIAFRDGTLPAKQQAKLQKAADDITGAAERRTEETYVTGRGTSRPLSEAALEARRQRAEGKSADMDVASVRDRKQAPIKARMEARADEAARLESEPAAPVPTSRAQERQLARDAERVRRAEATVKGETARGERLMKDAARKVESTQTRAGNRTGQVIGRARDRLERADQLETGLAARQKQAAAKARRLERAAKVAEDKAAKTPEPKPAAPKPEPKAEAPAAKPANPDLRINTGAHLKAAADGQYGAPQSRVIVKDGKYTVYWRAGDDGNWRGATPREAIAALKDAHDATKFQGYADEAARLEAAAKPARAPKLTAANRAAAKRSEATDARAESDKIKGVPAAASRSRVMSDVNLDAQRAHTASKIETETTNKLLADAVEQQRSAVEKAQKKLAEARSREAARIDKFERENQVRGDRAVEKRLAQLDERNARDLAKLEKAARDAADSVEAAPPQDRPGLLVAQRAQALALELAEAHPERASEFLAVADDIATTKAALDAKGIRTEFFFGGEDLNKDVAPPATATLRQAKRLASERQRKTGKLARSLKGQSDKHARETLDILHNEMRPKVQEAFGSKVGDELGAEAHRFSTGEELARALADDDLVAWDPVTGKLLDPADVTLDSAVLNQGLHKTLTKYTTPREAGFVLRAYDKATGKWKHTVLALSPRWHVGNIIGNAALATLGAGLSPAAIAQNIGEARRLVKAFEAGGEIPAEHQAALRRLIAAGYHNPDLGEVTGMTPGTSRASKMTAATVNGVGTVINKSYTFNEYVDSVNRTMVYLAKHKTGVSSEAAVQMALKAAGDFSKMTPFERNVVRRIIPFYAWQRHITRLAFSLPIEHPSRVAWTLHLAELQNRLNPDPGADNEFNGGTIPVGDKRLSVRSLDPYGSSFFLDPTFRGAGYSVNPVLKLGIAALTGLNVGKELKPVGTPENKGGYGEGAQFMSPARLAQFATQTVPQVKSIQDLVAGNAPVRWDTGQPRRVGPGATKKGAKPTLTGRKRVESLARLLGIPIPEPEQKAVTKKK